MLTLTTFQAGQRIAVEAEDEMPPQVGTLLGKSTLTVNGMGLWEIRLDHGGLITATEDELTSVSEFALQLA
jgi:hypothetical protein